MSKSEDDAALQELMRIIRQPAKDSGQTQAVFLLNLVKETLGSSQKEIPKQEGPKVSQFFNTEGRLISIPVGTKKKIAVLGNIARVLEPSRVYSEKELNEVLSKFHDDTAALRRHMIEFNILVRDNRSMYWLKV